MNVILGVRFINGNYEEAYKRLLNKKFMVVPSGPGLSGVDKNPIYYNAIKSADFAIPDSGFMIILTRFFLGLSINKLSGPKFLRSFLKEDILKIPNKLFLVDPNEKESNINRQYLRDRGIPITNDYQYVSPLYTKNNILDKNLISKLNNLAYKPDFIIINLAGGIQEPLGLYLRNNLSYKVSIICTGAAIAFETGQQARLPVWVDRFYLGWLARILQNPNLYFIRFLKAFRLIYVFYLCKTNKLDI